MRANYAPILRQLHNGKRPHIGLHHVHATSINFLQSPARIYREASDSLTMGKKKMNNKTESMAETRRSPKRVYKNCCQRSMQ